MKWLLGLFLALFAFLLPAGCVGSGSLEDGTVNMTLRPAIVWKVNTGLYFYGGEAPLLEIKGAKVSGSAQSKEEADDSG